MTIDLEQARQIVDGARQHASSQALKPLCVVVLDAGGHLRIAEREDGTSTRRFEIAFGKAHGAIALGASSRRIEQMALERPHFIAAATAAIGGSLMPVAGGVLLGDENSGIIGAVGVSGDTSDNDEAAALAGIAAAGLSAYDI